MKRTDIYVVQIIRWIYDADNKTYYFHETANIKAFKDYWDARYFIYSEYINKYNLKVDSASHTMLYDILDSSISEEFRDAVLDRWFDYIHVGLDKFGFCIDNMIFEDGEVE